LDAQFIVVRIWRVTFRRLQLGLLFHRNQAQKAMKNQARILIVDDEPDTVGLIELTLRPAGYKLSLAYSGADALNMLRNETFDLLLLDVMMPEITGFDVIRLLFRSDAG
jgi:response regulator RpfG family c-di-GMP phosphodiesterase